MFCFKKILTHILILGLIITHTGGFVFAEDIGVIHSPEELPSMQEYTDNKTILLGSKNQLDEDFIDSTSDLIREKERYTGYEGVTDQNNHELYEQITSDLVEQHEFFLAQTSLALTPIVSSLSPGFVTNPFTSINTSSVVSEFITEYQGKLIEEIIEESNGKKYTKKGRKVSGIKGDITAKIPEGVRIKSSSGELISTSVLTITSLENQKKNKAKIKYERSMKNRGTIRKGRTKAKPVGFDFGITDKHLIFSEPVSITIATPNMSEGIVVDILTMHTGDTGFHTRGLSVNPLTRCNSNGTATIPGAKAVVKNSEIVFYTCGASSFAINTNGGEPGSNDLSLTIGDCAEVQVYYNGSAQVYGGSPGTVGCDGSPSSWPILRVGNINYGNNFNSWTTNSTTGTTIDNTYFATTTMSVTVDGRIYQLIIDWSHTAPNKYFTWSWKVIVPTGNTLPVKFYYGMDSFVAGSDADDIGYFTNTGGTTIGIFDNSENILSAFRYISGSTWTGYQADVYNTILTQITDGNNFNNTIQTVSGDLGFGINWDFGTPTVQTTFSGTIEWRVLPYISSNVVDIIPGIGQPEGALTTGFTSQIPVTISNVGNISSSGVHTATLTIPTNILGPTTSFNDNGWSCGAQTGNTVTCTKNTTIASLTTQTLFIPVIPQTGAGGTSASFSVVISNPGDSNTTNNTALITNTIIFGSQNIAPGGVTGSLLWLKSNAGILVGDNQRINIWRDQSGYNNHISQTSVINQPIYKTSNELMNNNPVVDFDGVNLLIGPSIFTGAVSEFTAYVVAKEDIRSQNIIFEFQGGSNRIHAHYPWDNGDIYWDFGVCCGTSRLRVPAPFQFGDTTIGTFFNSVSASTQGMSVNGSIIASDNTAVTENATNTRVGFRHNGKITEFIVYNKNSTILERQKIESYLGIKYGITLTQTNPKDYILSNNKIIWNATLAGIYNKNITGIARDDTSGLNQVKSQSINNPGDIIVGTLSNTISSNSRANVWSNNGAGTGTFNTNNAPVGYQRIDREWLFQEKNGDIGMVKISYPVNSLPNNASSPIYMLVDSDTNFSMGATTITGTLNGTNWEWDINISDMNIITFGIIDDIIPTPSDTTPPVITNINIASGTLIPYGNFSLTYNYTDTDSGINPSSATGYIYPWSTITSSYSNTHLSGYSTIGVSNGTSSTLNITNLPHGRYKVNVSISDSAGNITMQSYTYFVDAIEWTISADNYNIGDISQDIQSFGTGELIITIKTVGAGFSLTTAPISGLTQASGETINYWNGSFGIGYDISNNSIFSNTLITYSPNSTLVSVAKNINQNGIRNTYIYRLKYGAQVDFMQAAGDYVGSTNFGLILDY